MSFKYVRNFRFYNLIKSSNFTTVSVTKLNLKPSSYCYSRLYSSKSTSDSSKLQTPFSSPQITPKSDCERPKTAEEQQKEAEQSELDKAYAPFPGGRNPATGEIGGPRGPEPTRYGDWERKGRCIDF